MSVKIFFWTGLIFLLGSCRRNIDSITSEQQVVIKDSVQKMAIRLAKDVSTDGPGTWLYYFENNADFFMASNGALEFSTKDSATYLMNKIVVKHIKRIKLQWKNIRIDVLSRTFASLAMNFHEAITDTNDQTVQIEGYFTALAHQTSQGWKLRNAHWSIKK